MDTDEEKKTETVSDFDPCGEVSDEATECAIDWDLDGVPDDEEPTPSNFLEQVQTMQCTVAGGDLSAVTLLDQNIFDIDEQDEDDEPYYVRRYNVGGYDDEEGESAFIFTDLTAGGDYVIVVGSGSDTGQYVLTIQEFVE